MGLNGFELAGEEGFVVVGVPYYLIEEEDPRGLTKFPPDAQIRSPRS